MSDQSYYLCGVSLIIKPTLAFPYHELKNKMFQLVSENPVLLKKELKATSLGPEAAIGQSQYKDYALLKGKEHLLQVEIDGYPGQAYTDQPGTYQGCVQDLLELSLDDDYERAVFIAALNGLLRREGVIQKSVHCRDDSPAQCSGLLRDYIIENFKPGKVVLVGYQPRFAETLASYFELRINDLDADNIGKKISTDRSIFIESSASTEDNIKWGDLIVVTGSVIVNGTIPMFCLTGKNVLFFGTSISGPAQVLGLNHFCPLSS